MKGDKNRGEKLFEKLKQGDSFISGVQEIRLKSKIPADGFIGMKQMSNWYKNPSHAGKMESMVQDFLQKQGLPNNFWWWQKVIEYILSDGEIELIPNKLAGHEPFIEVNYEPRSRTGGTGILLYPGANKEELDKFYKNNKELIEPVVREGSTRKMRSRENTRVIQRIRELYTWPKKDLGAKYNEPRELLVARKLKEEGLGNYKPESVKRIYYKTKSIKR
jgi:hypothetical protein